MKIAVVGTGGVGGYYGGLLARQGHNVTFIARGAHLKAIQKDGLQVKSVFGDFRITPANATAEPAGVGPVDLVLFCTKTFDTDAAAQMMQPLVGPGTSVLSLQNGVEAADLIATHVEKTFVIGGATWLSSAVEAPGVIHQTSQFRRVVIGELDGRITPRLQAFQRAFQEAGVTAETTQDILKVLWIKLVFIAAAGGLGSLTRLPLGNIRAVPETRLLMTALMKEVEAVGRARGVAFDPDVVDQSLAFVDAAAPGMKASMQLDVEAWRRSELEALIGVIGRMGRAASVSTPAADFVYAALLPIDLIARRAGSQTT